MEEPTKKQINNNNKKPKQAMVKMLIKGTNTFDLYQVQV